MTLQARARILLELLIIALLAAVGCDDPPLPSFANPPPVDAGADASLDEDSGSED